MPLADRIHSEVKNTMIFPFPLVHYKLSSECSKDIIICMRYFTCSYLMVYNNQSYDTPCKICFVVLKPIIFFNIP